MRGAPPPTVVGLLAAIAAALPGCGFTPPKTVPAAGKVMFRDGKPVTKANVQFLPEGGSGDAIANGTTDANGAFTLHTYFNETRSALDGAAPGKYKVEVTAYPGGAPLPARYGSPTDTPLRAEIPAGGTSTLKLEVDAGP